VTTNNLFSML